MVLEQHCFTPGGRQEETVSWPWIHWVLRCRLLNGDSSNHGFIIRETLVVICSICTGGESLSPTGPDAAEFSISSSLHPWPTVLYSWSKGLFVAIKLENSDIWVILTCAQRSVCYRWDVLSGIPEFPDRLAESLILLSARRQHEAEDREDTIPKRADSERLVDSSAQKAAIVSEAIRVGSLLGRLARGCRGRFIHHTAACILLIYLFVLLRALEKPLGAQENK